MGVRKTTLQFIAEAKAVHGDKYDYSRVEYVNTHTKVCIMCPEHGAFYITPCDHLHKHGCPHCARERQKGYVYGVGYNDLLYTRRTPSYLAWTSMLERCYSPRYQKQKTTYIGCTICKEWLIFSNFKKWFDDPENGYQEGYCLDKDILVKGNKVYSPNTCCIVPNKINSLLTNRKQHRGAYPIGVTKRKNGTYQARIGENRKNIGIFASPEEAFNVYKIAKEQHIKELAEKYLQEGKITRKVYNALMKYEVEITD